MNRRRFLKAAALSAAAPSVIPNALAPPIPTWVIVWSDFPPSPEFLAYDAKVRHMAARAVGIPPQ